MTVAAPSQVPANGDTDFFSGGDCVCFAAGAFGFACAFGIGVGLSGISWIGAGKRCAVAIKIDTRKTKTRRFTER